MICRSGAAVKEASLKRLQGEKTAARILEVTTRLLVNKGYHGTSIADITDAANVTKGALYCHFSSKSELLLALIGKFEREFLDQLIATVNDVQGDAWAKLNRFVSFASDFAERNRHLCLLLTIISAELHGSGSEFETHLSRLYSKYARFLARLVEEGKLQGVFGADVDTQTMAYVIIAFHDGILLQWQRSRDRLDGVEYVRSFRRALLHGVAPAPKTDKSA